MMNSFIKLMRQIGTVGLSTWRHFVHTRAVLWMLIGSILAAALPLALRGDGSAGSVLQLAVIYPPVLLFWVLLLGTVWMAAAAMAQEIENGTMATIIIKPIHRAGIWMGKWMGILLLNAALLTLAAAILILVVSRITNRALNRDSVSSTVGHRVFTPDYSALEQAAHERLFSLKQSAEPETDYSFAQILNTIKTENFRVVPGESCTWNIPVDPSVLSQTNTIRASWDLQFIFRCDPLSRAPVNGTWTLSSPPGPPRVVTSEQLLDGTHQLAFPRDLVIHPGLLTLTFSNQLNSSTVYFDPRSPVVLRQQKSSFPENLTRAFLVLFCFIAAAGAFALTMGLIFSFPVAVFTVCTLFLAIMISQAFAGIPSSAHSHGDVLTNGVVQHTGSWMLFHIHRSTASTLQLLSLHSLSQAQHISDRQIMQALLRLLAAIPALFCALGTLLLRRKEFP